MSDAIIPPSFTAITSAYGKARDTQVAATPETNSSASFADMVEEAAQTAVTAVRQGDQVASAGLSGQADLQAVVEATMAMESTVRVSVALRDKMVEAYQEIIRMPM